MTSEYGLSPMVDRMARARLHATLGDPQRLGIVEELAASDRSPSELAERFGLATNLVAHHLDVLAEVGLIERAVSAGDRRRRYVRLVRGPLAHLGVACPRPAGTTLFVCSHNSARSQLAAALWQHRTGGEASSAGTDPAPKVHPGAIAAAERAGLDLSASRPKLLAEPVSADVVVTVCDQAHEALDPDPDWWHWSLPDPVATGTEDAFDAVVADLDARITTLLSPEDAMLFPDDAARRSEPTR